MAPKNQATFDELQNKRPQNQVKQIPRHVLEFNLATPLNLDVKKFVECLRSAPSGSAPGPGGCTNEMWRVCLDDPEVTQLFFLAAEDLVRGTAHVASRPFLLATMTALQKQDGGVRGIVAGTTFRRLVAKVLARQFGLEVPFQFALSTRAGTDCVGHAIRAITDQNPRATVLSIDGIGAYDDVYRSAMMSKLVEVPGLQGLLPFVRTVYAQPFSHVWEDAEGRGQQVWQHEGGEQGDPLMPSLFSLAVHNSLEEVHQQLEPGEELMAFLDRVRARADQTNLQFIGREVVSRCWNQVA